MGYLPYDFIILSHFTLINFMTTQYILNKFSIFIYLILNVICATFEFIVWPGRFMISGLLKILNHQRL
jgi:hypothetical protein